MPHRRPCVQESIHAAVDKLLTLEKQQRLAEDVKGTKMACTAILDALFEAKEWKLLNENILLLAKRRSQLKQVMVLLSFSCFILSIILPHCHSTSSHNPAAVILANCFHETRGPDGHH